MPVWADNRGMTWTGENVDGDRINEDGLLIDDNGETIACSAETAPAVLYLRNGDPGYPAEYCDGDATHYENSEPLCDDHRGYFDGPEDMWDAMGIDTREEMRDFLGYDD